jgi:hypothetical protein
VAVGKPDQIAPETLVHRVGGGGLVNLRLSPLDRQLNPPGFSVLLGETPQAAARRMREAFPGSRKWSQRAATVGTTTAGAVRRVGFDVVPDPTDRFPNHARIIHPGGAAGFTDDQLQTLARVFQDTTGC